ncbi:MAG: porin [Duodenibacillus sp.]|nr:porin [Duodenibacillus sp.]
MRITRIAIASAAALAAAGAMAADVQIYGIVDTGLVFNAVNKDDGSGTAKSLEMSSGVSRGNRWGIKGAEDLGGGLKAGFVLESGVDTDTGALTAASGADKLFGREASVYLEGPWGKIGAGRLQQLSAGFGSWGVAAGRISPFNHGWGGNAYVGGYKMAFGFNSTRVDNGIAYKSPEFAGANLYAEYSTNMNAAAAGSVENKSSSDRYWGVAATWKNGPWNLYASAEGVNWANTTSPGVKDALGVTAGGNYNAGFATFYLAGQYFKNVKGMPNPYVPVQLKKGADTVSKGWGVIAGTQFKALAGSVRASLGYRSAKLVNDGGYTAKRITASAMYQYPLSKRTYLYGAAAYTRDKLEGAGTAKPWVASAVAGLSHTF